MASPKAVLAELVVVALLASVPETHHALAAAVGALHGVEDWRRGEGQRDREVTVSCRRRSARYKTKRNIKAKVQIQLEPKNCNCLLLVHLTSQSNLKICPGCSLEGLMLKLKLQYFGRLMRRADSFEKTLMLGKTESRRRRGRQDEIVGWHHRLNGHGFGWTPGVGDGQ